MTTQTTPSPLSVLTEEEDLFRQTVREFAESEIGPHVHDMDEASKMNPDLITKFFELGLMGIEVPEQYGGAGGTIFMAMLAIEEMARVDAASAIYVDVHNTLFNNALLRWGSDEQKTRYFPRLCTDLLAAFALSEPASGSDAFALETRATQDGDDWLLTGRKFWITSGAEAGIFMVFANVDPSKGYKGITGFLIERDFPGFSIGKREKKLGIRASSTVELILEQCRVPAANVLGQVGQGYKISIETLNEGRIGIGAQMVGVAQGALDAAIESTSRSGSSSARPSPNFRACSSRWRRWPPISRPRASWSTTRHASRTPDSPSPAKRRWRSSSPRTPPTRLRDRRSNSSAGTATAENIRPRSSIATQRSVRFMKAPATCNCRR